MLASILIPCRTKSHLTTCNNTSPDSVITSNTTPSRSPILRQHGPTLLPKIRTQDSRLEPSSAAGPKRTHRRVLSATNNPPAYAPYTNTRPPMQRSATEPVECTNLMSPVSNASYFGSRASSAAPSPGMIHAVPNRKHLHSHNRSSSSSSIDVSVLSRFGYPTYRQMPVYVSQTTGMDSSTVFAPAYPSYQSTAQFVEPPYINIEGTFDMPIDLSTLSRPSSTSPPPGLCHSSTNSLLDYLTQPTQACQSCTAADLPHWPRPQQPLLVGRPQPALMGIICSRNHVHHPRPPQPPQLSTRHQLLPRRTIH